MRTIVFMFLAALGLGACSASAADLQATPATFNATLARAKAGDTILATPGVYSGLALKNLSFSPAITITSAEPGHPATFTNFEGHNVHGVRFTSLEFAAKAPGYFVFGFEGCSDLHFDKISVHGSLDGDPSNDAEGIGMGGCSNVSITNSEFQQLKRAIAMNTSTDVLVSGNQIHDVQITGMVMAAMTNVKITHNVFHDLFPVGADHPDAIQFETRGQPMPSQHIEVSGNLIFLGAGRPAQGIFFRDQVGTLPFEDVSIADNLIVATGYGGILVMGAKGLTVTGNELVSNPGSTNNTWILIQVADGVTLANNRAQSITVATSSNVSKKDNKTTGPANDRGAEAVARWAAKPGFAALTKAFVPHASPRTD